MAIKGFLVCVRRGGRRRWISVVCGARIFFLFRVSRRRGNVYTARGSPPISSLCTRQQKTPFHIDI